MTRTMFDTVTPGAIGRIASTSPDAIAGYDDGRYNDISALEKAYPHHNHLSICVFAWDNGDCLDIENGDATPSEAPGWVRRQHARGEPRPVLYANSSTMPSVISALDMAGIPRHSVRLWRAQYDNVAALQPNDDAKQYTDQWHGRNVDASVISDDFFALAPARPRPKPHTRNRNSKRRAVAAKVKVHPKVIAATGGGGTATGLIALSHLVNGLHITSTEGAALATVIAAILGYLIPGSAKP